MGVGPVVGGALGEPRHGLDAGRDERVALAGLDRVERHPGGLHRRRAVAGDRRAGHLVEAHQHVDDPRHVVAGLAARQPAAEVVVVDRLRVQLGDLGQRGLDDRRGQVVGTELGERALVGAADGGAGGGDDDGFRHAPSLDENTVPPGCGRRHASARLRALSACRTRARDVGQERAAFALRLLQGGEQEPVERRHQRLGAGVAVLLARRRRQEAVDDPDQPGPRGGQGLRDRGVARRLQRQLELGQRSARARRASARTAPG